jgi:hypothetical protein
MTRFLEELRRQEVAPKTVASYRSDLAGFAQWFERTIGQRFTAAAVTPPMSATTTHTWSRC